jgi:hypothetical protein
VITLFVLLRHDLRVQPMLNRRRAAVKLAPALPQVVRAFPATSRQGRPPLALVFAPHFGFVVTVE